jgi:hypothetical protein
MLCREIIAVCADIHTDHINTRCGQNVEIVKAKPGGTYCQQEALKGHISDISLKYCWRFSDSTVCCRVYVPHIRRLICRHNTLPLVAMLDIM